MPPLPPSGRDPILGKLDMTQGWDDEIEEKNLVQKLDDDVPMGSIARKNSYKPRALLLIPFPRPRQHIKPNDPIYTEALPNGLVAETKMALTRI